MFSQACVIISVHGGGGGVSPGRVCIQAEICPGEGLPRKGLHPGGDLPRGGSAHGRVCPGEGLPRGLPRGVCIQGVCIWGVVQTPQSDTMGYGQRASGAHPTGMHSRTQHNLSLFEHVDLFETVRMGVFGMVKNGAIAKLLEYTLCRQN